MKHYYRKIEGYDILVTVVKPLILNEQINKLEESKYCSAFKFHQPPGIITGEFLYKEKCEKEMRWFDTSDQAADAAFDEAIKLIKSSKQA